jgi:transcriptional regulator with XRE-family HTH domain
LVDTDIPASRAALGLRIRLLRRQRELTLAALGAQVGLTASALSKVEKGSVSISFDALTRLARALNASVQDLFEETEVKQTKGMLAVTRSGEGRLYETDTYVYRMLGTTLLHKRMLPIATTIKARTAEDFGPLIHHSGEEFLYVLRGSVSLLSELYEPIHLAEGDSIYFDSSMGHGAINTGEGDAEVLWVALGREGDPSIELHQTHAARRQIKEFVEQ